MTKNKPVQNILKCSFKILLIILVPIAIGWLVYWGFLTIAFNGNPFATNRAKEVAKPIEKSLIEAGAVKVCDAGVTGREATNKVPRYSSRFQLNVGKDQAIEIVKKAAADNGYALEFKDRSGGVYELDYGAQKVSTYTDMLEGNINVNVSLHTNTAEDPLKCSSGSLVVGESGLIGDDSHTAFSLGVGLPAYKD